MSSREQLVVAGCRMRPPWLRAARSGGLLLLIVVIHALGYRFVTNVLHAPEGTGGSALSDYIEAGRLVWHGDLYAINYAYPPVFALATSALAALPRPMAALLWYEGQLLCIVGVLVLGRRLLDVYCARMPVLALGLAVVVSTRFLLNNLLHGNVNAFVLLLALHAALALERGREARAGVALAVAASLKLLPLLFLPVLIVRGSRRAAGTMLAALVVLNLLAPATLLGWDRSVEVFDDWRAKMVSPYAHSPVARFDERNLALSTALERHFVGGTGTAERSPFDLHVLGPDAGRLLILGVLGAIGLATLASAWRSHQRGSGSTALHDVAVVLAALLLVSPKTWTAHYVWLFPAVLWLAADRGVRARSGQGLRAVGLLAALILVLSSRGVIGRNASEIVQACSVPTACALAIWLATLLQPPSAAVGAEQAHGAHAG